MDEENSREKKMSILKWPRRLDEIAGKRCGVMCERMRMYACVCGCVCVCVCVCVCGGVNFSDLELKTIKAEPAKLFR